MRQIEAMVCLKVLDTLWISHLQGMQYLRDSVRLRAYGQRDPLVEYKNEGHRMFQELLNRIEDDIVQTIFKAKTVLPGLSFQQTSFNPVRQQTTNRAENIAHKRQQIIESKQQKIGRNEPCPCGSNKKYKKCCGK